MRSLDVKYVVIIVAVAALARMALALSHPFFFPDSADYDALGRALAHGSDYVAGGMYASRMPGYPLYLAACYRVCGDSARAALVIQALIGGATAVWVYLLCAGWDRRCGLVAAALFAVDPLSVAFSGALLSETLFTFFMLGALVALQRIGQLTCRRVYGWGLWLAAAWAAAVYLRPSVLWCAVPIVGWQVWHAWRGRDGLRAGTGARLVALTLTAYLITALTLVPWWERNYTRFHTGYFRMTTLDGKFLYESLSPQTNGIPALEKIVTPPDMAAMNEGEQADEFKRRAWGFARADPWREARLALVKAGRTWNPLLNAAEYQSPVAQSVLALWHVPLYLLAVLGVYLMRRSWWDLGILLWPMAYFTGVHMVYLGSVRYRVPLMPLICILAAAGILYLLKWLRGGKRLPS